MISIPTYADVLAAAARIRGAANETPVLTSRNIDEAFGAQLFFKCENLQRAGAFKFRGAFNALSRLSESQRAAGVATFSSGNHAQAIALAAKLLGMSAIIVMPLDAPASKMAATKAYGGRIVTYDRYREDRSAICDRLAAEDGLTLIPPFDHPDVIAGQGTAAREFFEEVGDLDALFVCLGGGGLLSGSLLAARALSASCTVYGAEPEAGNDGQQSIRAGHIVHIDTPRTIADGAQSQHLGTLTFEIIRQSVADIVTVSDRDLIDCMHAFATHLKLIVEPTGCLGFAAARRMRRELQGRRIGIIISGGNVDMPLFCELLQAQPIAE